MIDLRSDTVTKPTDKMRTAMAAAIVGDDVYGDDPTINELELYGAKLVGKEAALFIPSGTFGNQLSLLTHTNPSDEVILADNCHIVQHEAGSSALIAGVQLRTIDCKDGIMPIEDITKRIRVGNDIHYPKTALICLENAHSNGIPMPISYMKEVRAVSEHYQIPIHLDGARLFNAAEALEVDVQEITDQVDTVMFCLSKGLCAPVGSLLAGKKSFIELARKNRKVMGGGMRQAGILAAAGLIGLKDMRLRLGEDHVNAKTLAEGLAKIEGIEVDLSRVMINLVFFKLTKSVDDEHFIRYMASKGIAVNGSEHSMMRFATHNGISKANIRMVLNAMSEYMAKLE